VTLTATIYKNPSKVLALWAGERIHRAEALELYAFGRELKSVTQEF
jgi:hypothetical protein